MLKCPICLFSDEDNKFKVLIADSHYLFTGKLVRHRCPKCGVIFGTQEMLNLTLEELGAKYKELFDGGYVGFDSTNIEVAVFNYLNPRKDGVYLNWGAGSKLRTSEILKNKGYTLYGFEPYESSTKKDDLTITDFDALATMKFDGIMSNDFIEHVQSPVDALIDMKKYLKDSSCIMAHSTECWHYVYEISPFHLFFFEGHSIAVMADRADLLVTHTDSPRVKLFRCKP